MMLSDVIPVRKTLKVIRPDGRKIIHRKDSWWLYGGSVFGGRERVLWTEPAELHQWWCLRVV